MPTEEPVIKMALRGGTSSLRREKKREVQEKN
jgi:hypothetical protein